MARRYWFEIAHFALWLALSVALFFRQEFGLAMAIFAMVLCVAALGINIWYRDVGRSLMILAAPVLAAAIILPLQTGRPLNWVQFKLSQSVYQARLASMPSSDGRPRLVAFGTKDRSWQRIGSNPFLPSAYISGDYLYETLVYDEGGEIMRPVAQRSPAWRARAQGQPFLNLLQTPETATHRIDVTAMGGNWYWVEQLVQHAPQAG